MATCAAVIVNFNAGPYLRQAVGSITGTPDISEIIVVDNASGDGSLDLLAPAPGLTLVRNEDNLGFAAACNIGIERSRSDVVLLLNPDCVVEPGAVRRLMDVMATSERVGMVGPRLVNADGSEQAGGRRMMPTPWLAFVRTTGLSRFYPKAFDDFALHQRPVPDGPVEIEAISGACMLVRRKAIEDVGPLDAGYFLHCEDLDWCMRFLQGNWEIMFVPDARVIHHKGVSSRPMSLRVELYKHRGMARFYRKFYAKKHSPWFSAFLLGGIWARFAATAARIQIRRGMGRIWKMVR
jgi:GT2 family glycosyltransferase